MPSNELTAVTPRRATEDDAAALVALRALMMQDMGRDDGDPQAPWRAVAHDWFAARLRLPGEFAAFVVDDPQLGVVSSAVGICDGHAPGPSNLSGLRGNVSSVSTDPRCRRRGYARLCLSALLDWFREDTEVSGVNLTATSKGIELYRSLGFDTPRYPALQLRMPRTVPAGPGAVAGSR